MVIFMLVLVSVFFLSCKYKGKKCNNNRLQGIFIPF